MKKKTNELWLDGLYMSMPFLVRYGKMFGDENYCYSEAIKQYKTYASHLQDPVTGLLFHAYDEDGSEPWALPPENHSPEFWGRSVGWFVMGLVEILEIIPADFEGRQDLITILEKALTGLARYQDQESGLWFQVINKENEPGNWLESSCSIMYSYALRRSVQKGYVNDSLNFYALKGYAGVMTRMNIDFDGKTELTDICEGTGVGDYNFYINRARLVNNNHGLGAFIIMNELFMHDKLFLDELNAYPSHLNQYPYQEAASFLKVFPNPAQNEVTLSGMRSDSPLLNVEFYSASGEIRKTISYWHYDSSLNQIKIDIGDLSPGIWFGRIISDSGENGKFGFVKTL